jgi:hypothetical protein
MSTSTERLATLIGAKLQVLEVLARLARRQLELIEAADMTGLIKLLAAKQSVMNQLQRLEQELAPFRDEDPERRCWTSPSERAACQAQAERCNGFLAEVMQLESRAETAMISRRELAAAALAEVENGSAARFAYVSHAAPVTAIEIEG